MGRILKWLWIAFLCLILFFVIIWLVTWLFSNNKQLKAEANLFVDNIQAENFADAYDATSQLFKDSISLEDFTTMMGKSALSMGDVKWTGIAAKVENGMKTKTYNGTVYVEEYWADYDVTYTTLKEGKDYNLISINVDLVEWAAQGVIVNDGSEEWAMLPVEDTKKIADDRPQEEKDAVVDTCVSSIPGNLWLTITQKTSYCGCALAFMLDAYPRFDDIQSMSIEELKTVSEESAMQCAQELR